MAKSSNFEIGYQQALSDIVNVFNPIVSSIKGYVKSGNVMDVVSDISGFIDEINILNGRNKK